MSESELNNLYDELVEEPSAQDEQWACFLCKIKFRLSKNAIAICPKHQDLTLIIRFSRVVPELHSMFKDYE